MFAFDHANDRIQEFTFILKEFSIVALLRANELLVDLLDAIVIRRSRIFLFVRKQILVKRFNHLLDLRQILADQSRIVAFNHREFGFETRDFKILRIEKRRRIIRQA